MFSYTASFFVVNEHRSEKVNSSKFFRKVLENKLNHFFERLITLSVTNVTANALMGGK